MENNLMIFEDQQVEVFELNGIAYFNPYHVGNCLENIPNPLDKLTS